MDSEIQGFIRFAVKQVFLFFNFFSLCVDQIEGFMGKGDRLKR